MLDIAHVRGLRARFKSMCEGQGLIFDGEGATAQLIDVYYFQNVLLDVSALVAGEPVEFINGIKPSTPYNGTKQPDLSDKVSNDIIVGVYGLGIGFPQGTLDRADEDETQTALAIISDGKLQFGVDDTLEVSCQIRDAIRGQAAYRSAAGDGTEFTRGGIEDGPPGLILPDVVIVPALSSAKLQAQVDTAALATNAQDVTLTGGLWTFVASTRGLSLG